MKRSTCCLIALLALIGLWANAASAQYKASLEGTIADAQSKAIPGAQITLTDKETNRVLSTQSNEVGAYRIGGLPPSRCVLTVQAGGFKKKVLENVEILAEQPNGLDVKLEVGSTSETVTVSADVAPVMDTESATMSSVISSNEIQNMPAPGRDPFQLIQLSPGLFGDGAQAAGGGVNNLPGSNGTNGSSATAGIFATENAPQISVAGGRREVNNYQIDGLGTTSAAWGGTSIITPNMDSVKDITVVTNNYDAEDGRYSGGQVKVTTQNGTNSYHGTGFWRAARPGLNAYQSYNGYRGQVVRNNTQLNDLGGSLGAPILHNRLFGFFSFETILTNGAANAQGWYETSQYRAAAPANSAMAAFVNFPGSAPLAGTVLEGPGDHNSCSDIGLQEGVTCNTISGEGLDIGSPLKTALGTQDPTWGGSSSVPGVGSGLDMVPDIQYISQNYNNPQTEQQYNGRIDYNLSSKDLIAVNTYLVPNTTNGYNGTIRAMDAFKTHFFNRTVTLLWDHTFSPNMQNEFRANNGGWKENNLESNPQAPFGLPTIGLGNLGGFNPIGSIGLNGFGVGTPAIFDQSTYNGKDVLTKVHRSHTIKMGGEVTRLLFVDDAPWNARPNYTFNSIWDQMNDAPVTESATFNSTTGVPTDFRRDTRETFYGFYVQDSYKMKPNLTLTAGLRYDYFGPMSEKYGHLAVVVLGPDDAPISGVTVRKGGNLFNAQKGNFGPQLGFSWSPSAMHQQVVIRGGFGIGFTALQEANTLDGRNNPPYLSGYLQLTGSQITYGPNTFPTNPHSFYGYASNPATTATFSSTTNLPVPGQNFALAPLQAYQANWPTTATYRYSLDMQYDLFKDWVVTLGYQGTEGRHLTRLYNDTLYQYAKLMPSGNQMNAFNPSVQNVNIYDDEANSSFNALLFGVRHRFSHSFELESDLHWSKSLDVGSSNYTPAQGGSCQCGGGALGPYQYYPMNTDKGPSDFNATDQLKVFGVWTPQYFKGQNKLLEKVLGAWSLSGILNAHTGFPWTPTDNNLGGSAVYQNSGSAYGGGSPLRPFKYNGGLNVGNFKVPNYNNLTGAENIFPEDVNNSTGQPCYVAGPSMSDIVNNNATPGPIPCAPAIGRNGFKGPGYFDIDATIGKKFGLPSMRVIGEHGAFEIHANIYNLINHVNLTGIDNNIPDPTFGVATGALGSRTIDLQARISF